jgi:hypothetical protein
MCTVQSPNDFWVGKCRPYFFQPAFLTQGHLCGRQVRRLIHIDVNTRRALSRAGSRPWDGETGKGVICRQIWRSEPPLSRAANEI